MATQIPDVMREVLIERRKNRGMSQADLAAVMSTSQSAISDLENGRDGQSVVLTTLKNWCDALDFELEFVLTDKLPPLRFKV